MKYMRHALLALALLFNLVPSGQVRASDINDEYRLTILPFYPFSKELVGFGYLGFVPSWDKDYMNYYAGAGFTYDVNSWLQTWTGLIGSYTDDWDSSNKLEIRPFVGAKFFLPNELGWNIFAFPRYEYRMLQDVESNEWDYVHRARLRLGVEIPLTSKENGFKPKTWYAIADVEPMYRFDVDRIDPFRVRAGLGYVIGGGKKIEFIYHAQWTRPENGGLEYTDNIFRINIKFPLGKGPLAEAIRHLEIDD
ncbi:MAG: DUF2490 domain-containing protein [Verrucomicrobiaceae bacterium]|nr:DUF2490 domain-containing protein [Verrucomicrobiaceae bacterium]